MMDHAYHITALLNAAHGAGLHLTTAEELRRKKITEATAADFEMSRRRDISDANEKRPSEGAQHSTAMDDREAGESNTEVK